MNSDDQSAELQNAKPRDAGPGQTRYSQRLPTLLSALHLLYVGRALAGFIADEQSPRPPVDLDAVDATIEAFTDEIRATELLHEAALLVGDVK